MTWSDLHYGKTVYGKRIGSTQNLGGRNGLPNQAVLSGLLNKAQSLDLERVYKGMSFTWCRALVENQIISFHNETKIIDKGDKSSSICYEDRAFPINPGDGYILIRQSLAPCARCRAAFRAWAAQRGSSIIVSADKGYDNSPDNTVFIFTQARAVYQWS